MTDKQIIKADENMLRLNDICVTCVSEIEECDCRKVAEDLYLKLSRKEQECEELKNKIKELLHDCNSCNFHKYKQALNEIKEIASLCSYVTPKDFYETRMKQILQKISEVLDE